MAVVTGDLTDFGAAALTPLMPIIRWHPRTAKGSVSRRGGTLLPHKPIDATILGTEWTIVVVPTVGTVPASWFEIEIIHLDAAGNFISSWWWAAKVYVPVEGGTFPTLPGGPLSPDSVWVSLTPPPQGWSGYWLYSPSPDQTMPLNDPEIGMLRSVTRG